MTNKIEEDFFKRVKSITSESHYKDEREREVFNLGFKEALGMVHIELFGTPKTKGFLKEQIELSELNFKSDILLEVSNIVRYLGDKTNIEMIDNEPFDREYDAYLRGKEDMTKEILNKLIKL